jgi:drug/metabolite transporter (DMT)-like permease
MAFSLPWIRDRLDRVGLTLSCLCAVHCVATVVVVAMLGVGGSFLLDPAIHRVGLALAMLIAAVAIGLGALRHRQPGPLLVALTGLSFMGGALAVPHGTEEALLTIIGVILLAAGHVLNVRHLRSPGLHRAP